jgi:hypothetical protein
MRLVACVSQFEGPQSFIPAVRLYVDPLPSPMKVGITKLNRVSAKRYMAKVHGRLPTLPRKRGRQGGGRVCRQGIAMAALHFHTARS